MLGALAVGTILLGVASGDATPEPDAPTADTTGPAAGEPHATERVVQGHTTYAVIETADGDW